MTDKPICWMGSSLEDLSDFPESARRKAGFQLRLIQGGEEQILKLGKGDISKCWNIGNLNGRSNNQ